MVKAGGALWRRSRGTRTSASGEANGTGGGRRRPGAPDATLASFRRFRSSHRADAYCRVKLTVTVMSTGTGTPFSRVGV